MRPRGKSAALGAAFSVVIALAANADPLYRGGAGSSQPPRPQTATLPPANAARAPGNETQQFDRLGPTAPRSSSSHDGSYAGWMTLLASGQFRSNPACVSRAPVSMKIERDNVTISYTNWQGQAIHYHGKLDPTGKIDAWHANSDGSGSLLAGQIGDSGFTGHMMARDLCSYDLTLQTSAATTGSAAR